MHVQQLQQLEKLKGKKGTYVLLFRVARRLRVLVGKKRRYHTFSPGIWVYLGSALGPGGLGCRLSRHFSTNKKRHWHIDYLFPAKVQPLDAIWIEAEESLECELATTLWDNTDFEPSQDRFGDSDCKNRCGTHLFRYAGSGGISSVRARIRQVFLKEEILEILK